ncbi:MAG: DUF4141 domain-containing protein [Prevotella sp.]|nr:DUF4141 domain-containing protein [Prevotella sp.]
MRTKVIMTICLFLLMVGKASAQWSVIDPTNIAQSIINSSNNIVHTSSTAQNMINNFKETVKIYEQPPSASATPNCWRKAMMC